LRTLRTVLRTPLLSTCRHRRMTIVAEAAASVMTAVGETRYRAAVACP
jgi:hypothetical protein